MMVMTVFFIQDLVATVSPEKAATEILINAHQHEISYISMNQQGTMIATCSSKVHGACIPDVAHVLTDSPQRMDISIHIRTCTQP